LLVGLALVLSGCGVRAPALRAPSTPGAAPAARPPSVSAPPATSPVTGVSTPAAASTDRSTLPVSVLPPAGVSVGQPAPDFALPNPSGQTVRLSDFRGQPVAVNFFTTWCGPCKDELPQYQAAYQQHRDQGFQVILVDLKESPNDVGAFAAKLELTMPIVVDDRGTVAAEKYRLTKLPTTVFVDASGLVRGVQVGPLTGEALNDSVTALLSGETVQASSPAASQSGAGPLCDCP
jgi:peroxiredoxin